jgi:hypothetical protein
MLLAERRIRQEKQQKKEEEAEEGANWGDGTKSVFSARPRVKYSIGGPLCLLLSELERDAEKSLGILNDSSSSG